MGKASFTIRLSDVYEITNPLGKGDSSTTPLNLDMSYVACTMSWFGFCWKNYEHDQSATRVEWVSAN
jgi:hypothetical protein